MKPTLILIYILGCIAGAAFALFPRRLAGTLEEANHPISLPRGKQLRVRLKQYSRLAPIRKEGLEFEVVDEFNRSEKVMDQLKAARQRLIFAGTDLFKNQLLHIFSKPYVRYAEFLEWTDREFAILKQGFAHPDRIAIELFSDDYKRLRIEFRLDSDSIDGANSLLTFFKLTPGTFTVHPEDLKKALDHATGVPFPKWTADQITTKLANDPTHFPFHVKMTRDSELAELTSRLRLTYFDSAWQETTEEFDPATGYLIEFNSAIPGFHFVKLVNANNDQITINHNFDKRDAHKGVFFNVFFPQPVQAPVPEGLIGAIFQKIKSVEVPQPIISKVARHIAQANGRTKFGVDLEANIDARIWQLFTKSQSFSSG